jgi:hypothetical protein
MGSGVIFQSTPRENDYQPRERPLPNILVPEANMGRYFGLGDLASTLAKQNTYVQRDDWHTL